MQEELKPLKCDHKVEFVNIYNDKGLYARCSRCLVPMVVRSQHQDPKIWTVPSELPKE